MNTHIAAPTNFYEEYLQKKREKEGGGFGYQNGS